ncbi:MAG TPA: hypothetical protein GX747_00870, partial [Tenericutes bacterium]|nr:hypothetical protein [Mycoplasmatota bacterium]
MFDEYINKQNIACKIFENAINNNALSHAYLIESNNYNQTFNYILSVVKYIICGHKKSEEKCNICEKIENGSFEELKIIEPEGLWIKKEQIEELQNEFLKKPIYSNKKIYIINEVEKLNTFSSASLLKFLEEPEENIIAILITNNIYSVLDTITSRCQLIKLNRYNEIDYSKHDNKTIVKLSYLIDKDIKNIDLFIKDNESLFKDFINFYIEYEKNKKSIIYNINKIIDKINNKDKLSIFF